MNGITVLLSAYVWILVPLFPNAGHTSAYPKQHFSPPPGPFNPVGRREIASRASAVIPPAVGSHLLTGMEA